MNSNFLLQKRIDAGLSQARIADVLGYSIQTISLWESSKGSPALPIWGKYASLLKIDLEGFLFDKDKRSNLNCDTYTFDIERFSSNLRVLRKKKNITQAALAKAINASTISIIRFEKGTSFPSLNQFISLCNFFHQSVDELYFALSFKKSDEPKKKKIILPILIPIVIAVTAGGVTTGVIVARNRKNKSDTPNISNDTPDISNDTHGRDTDDTSSTSSDVTSDGGNHETGETISYGQYPQTRVSDNSLIAQLELLVSPNAVGFYEYNGGYYFKETSHLLEESLRIDGGCFFNDDTPISDNTPYWFKVDPIKWRIVDEDESSYTLFSDVILDASLFSSGEEKTNNYSTSELRQFLNNDFCDKAFFGTDLPLVTEVDNSLSSTGDSVNHYTCDNTFDRVFVPSRVELGYITGYDPDADTKRNNRKRLTSEYARIKATAYSDYAGLYWTRTPNAEHSDRTYVVEQIGGISNNYCVDSVFGISVCPMIRISK